MSGELDEARRKLAESAMDHILGGVAELREMGAIMPGPIAAVFADIGHALHRGEDPMEVAVVCFAAANALRSPEDRDEIQRAAEDTIAGMQARTAGPAE